MSYLSPEEQEHLLDAMNYSQNTPSLSQAQTLKKLSKEGRCTQEAMYSIMSEEKKLAELADAEVYEDRYAKWAQKDLPILPDPWQYVVSHDKSKQFALLRSLMNRSDVTTIINACDAGREGELIFRTVYHLAGCTKPMKRLWISSMEDSAIREGFANLRDGSEYDNLYASALCRSKADWTVGINATRLFSVLYHRTLNVGRVVSPTLSLLVQREAEINAFLPELFYNVALELPGFTATSE